MTSTVQDLVRCSVCGVDHNRDETKHLPLYAVGSEGVFACEGCRMVLTEVVRGMMRACGRAHQDGWRKAKTVAAAKSDTSNAEHDARTERT
jgi:hypothetical protein